MNSLLIDVGSTFIKFGVYDKTTKTMCCEGKLPFPEPSLSQGKRFVVPLAKIRERILEIFEQAKAFGITSAFLSVQMHGFVLQDEDGKFGDYISWRDKTAELPREGLSNVDFDQMGTALKENLPLAKLAFCDLRGTFFTLGSYLSWLLTGNNATHTTDACASGFFFADSGKPNEFSGKLQMPRVFTEVCEVGMFDGIRIYTPMGDHQISFLGCGANTDSYLLNIGTATQVSCLNSATHPSGAYEKRPFFDENRLYTVSNLVGGGRLMTGDGFDELLLQIQNAISVLPKKKNVVVGGGGAEQIYEKLTSAFSKQGLSCSRSEANIGMEGLKMIADAVEKREIKAGTMLSEIAFSNFPIIAKNSGLDFVIVDNEHGYFDYTDIAQLAIKSNLAGLSMIVRIGESSRGHITKLADMGVNGFLLPMTNTVEDIARVISFAKYPPVGKRGVSTTRAHTLYNPPPLLEYMEAANEKMQIYAQIETVEGVKNVNEILKHPDVSGIFIGPNDLSVDMNSIGDKDAVLEVILSVIDAANAIGKPCGIITGDKKFLDAAIKRGIKMISIGSELNMLIQGCKNIKERTNG